MISLEINKVFKIKSPHGNLISQYLEKIHKRHQGFLDILSDKKQIEKIENFAQKNKNKFKDIVVLGIGGSALGTTFLSQSLKPTAHLHVLDNIDPTMIAEVEEKIDYKKTLFLVVTKSGDTIETMTQYFYFRKKIESKKLNPLKHFVFITGPKTGLLREIANKEKFETFDVPENVGGRFSILTAVSLLPAKLIGIDIKKLVSGAEKFSKKCTSKNPEENPAFTLALIQYLNYKKGKNINVIMPYSQKLIKFTDWYKQLLAESTGKKYNNKKEKIFAGITPLSAIGTTDQHSQLQLFIEGPNDKLIIFIEPKKYAKEIVIPNPFPTKKEFNFFNKKITFNKILTFEKKGVEQALTEKKRPNITIKIDEVNEKTIGELIILFETSIAFLGELLNINVFNQPSVELSKKYAKQLIAKEYNIG